ncbi:MAG: 3-deoxy-7-phosphoheptulonate synthase [Actinomycetes bacterium]|nr:3-deoxy-7-phosphoheptulonate synthase [Actinomycetes bacterium]
MKGAAEEKGAQGANARTNAAASADALTAAPAAVDCGTAIGAQSTFTIIAGPCAVESRTQLAQVAATVSELGLHHLRAGAYKPRTSPYSFQGLGAKALPMLRDVAAEFNLRTVTEICDPAHADAVADVADILQIGTRNMANYALLKTVGRLAAVRQKPVLLKRGMAATIEEWLQAAEYLRCEDAAVLFCERGIRTFETATRFTLDVMAVPLVKQLAAATVLVDVSHATGRADLVPAAARAALAAGADGIMVEVHPDPAHAKSDGRQSLTPAQLMQLCAELTPLAVACGKKIV